MKVFRQKKKIKENKRKVYFETILEKEKKNRYDIVFIIKGSSISNFFYEKMKKINSDAKWVSYQWDDIENCKEFLNFSGYFDKIFTYSLEDSKKYGFIYKPFFFSYKKDNLKKEFDVSFIGTAHSDRLEIVNKILPQLKSNKIKSYFRVYISKEKYLKKLLWLKKEKNIYITEPKPYKEVIEIFSKSKVILEIQHPKQKTITTRSIEALGTKTKVITTVEDIKNQDFYSEDNFFVIDRKNPSIPINWINKPFKETSEKVLEKYELKNWIGDICGN